MVNNPLQDQEITGNHATACLPICRSHFQKTGNSKPSSFTECATSDRGHKDHLVCESISVLTKANATYHVRNDQPLGAW